MKGFLNGLGRTILAGICIGIGSFVNMKIGGVAGAIMFAFGLLVIVKRRYALFTGLAGMYPIRLDILLFSIVGNFIGCGAVGLIGKYCSPFDMSAVADTVIAGRIACGPLNCFLLSILCGTIVTWAVQGGRMSNVMSDWMPLFLGVPVFILAGFPHCIADIYSLTAVSDEFLKANWQDMLAVWGSIIAGNYVGCNLFRINFFPEEAHF